MHRLDQFYPAVVCTFFEFTVRCHNSYNETLGTVSNEYNCDRNCWESAGVNSRSKRIKGY